MKLHLDAVREGFRCPLKVQPRLIIFHLLTIDLTKPQQSQSVVGILFCKIFVEFRGVLEFVC
jgi:hypothetical protein